MARHKKLSFTTRYVVVAGIILLAANILLGVVGFQRSAATIKTLINKDMLDLANTAAALIDGDELEELTEEDVGSEAYNHILKHLTSFQDHADIHFIYAVRQVGEKRFVFLVDADPNDPADFGEDIVVSAGLVQAGKGIAAVDDMPLEDEWGYYYSAYSPVFDSAGRVAGVVGLDFDADWYDEQVKANTIYIAFTSILSIVGIGVVVLLITNRIHRKFQGLNNSLSALSASVDQLTKEVSSFSGKVMEHPEEEESSADELEELNRKINKMQASLGLYLEHLQTQAYVDALTKVSSSSAYHETLQTIDGKIRNGSARFCVGVFDINSLKEINDQQGHEYGDLLIKSAAKAISAVFGTRNTYRIGGDEFAVVLEQADEVLMAEKMTRIDKEIAAFNAEKLPVKITLAVSKGIAAFRPEQDQAYKDVFARADQRMYMDKTAYYQTHADRRRNHRG